MFRAKLHLEMPGGDKRLVDCRPSDAMALALRVGASSVRRGEGPAAGEHGAGEGGRRAGAARGGRPWKEFLEELDPDAFGKYKM